ncbi:MAG: hypothetical protein ACE5G0_00040 [Rhodothermales bacterium]
MAVDAIETPWSVTYHDGSGNGFRFWQETEGGAARFDYLPITPEISSSGSYSGGEPKKGILNAEHVEELWRWVRRLEAETSLHINARVKGSGAFYLTTSTGEKDFIITNSSLLRQFNAFLLPLRGE